MSSFQDMAATSFYGSQSQAQATQQATPDSSQFAPGSQPTQPASSSTAVASGSGTQTSRAAAEEARKDRTLAEFLLMLDEYEPLVRALARLVAAITDRHALVRSRMR